MFGRPVLVALVGVMVLVGRPAMGRWGTLDDAGIIQRSLNVKVSIRQDGNYEENTESLVEIHNDDGRRDYANLILSYNSGNTKLHIHKAKTLTDKSEITVDKDLIDDKPAPNSNVAAFGLERQVTVAFPKVEIGSRLYAKWEQKSMQPVVPKFYSRDCYFGFDRFLEKASYEFVSELPLFIEVNDPQNKLLVENKRDGDKYRLTIRLKSPVFEQVFDERGIFIRHRSRTWVGVSTFKDYKALGKFGTEANSKLLAEPLPPSFQAIADKAKAKPAGVEQLNEVTAAMATQMRYLMDWRAMDSGMVARPLETIARTNFGDCKDFALTATAIFRRLGYDAQVAWVTRGSSFDGFLSNVALYSSFNHAITRVKWGSTIYWIDPTNAVSFAQGIQEDIADRPALVLYDSGSAIESIPAPDINSSVISRRYQVKLDPSGDGTMTVKVTWAGRSAVGLANDLLRFSKESIKTQYTQEMAEGKLVGASTVLALPEPSRIVRDLTMEVNLQVRNLNIRTTAGPAYRLDSTTLKTLSDLDTRDRVSDLFLVQPTRQYSTYELTNLKPVGKATGINCVVDSPWFKLDRKTGSAKGKSGFVVEDLFEIKRSLITADELRSDTYAKFQKGFRRCFYDAAVVYQLSK